MKDELIKFPIAKLAKEKGFDWETYKYYELALNTQKDLEFESSGPFGWKEGELNLQSSYFINNHKNIDSSNISWYVCAAPTQSLLQKWLREVHGIYIVVDYYGKDEYSTEVLNYKGNNIIKEILKEIEFKTYEEALERGLVEALKLIKS